MISGKSRNTKQRGGIRDSHASKFASLLKIKFTNCIIAAQPPSYLPDLGEVDIKLFLVQSSPELSLIQASKNSATGHVPLRCETYK